MGNRLKKLTVKPGGPGGPIGPGTPMEPGGPCWESGGGYERHLLWKKQWDIQGQKNPIAGTPYTSNQSSWPLTYQFVIVHRPKAVYIMWGLFCSQHQYIFLAWIRECFFFGSFFFVCFERLLLFFSLHALRENNKTLCTVIPPSQKQTIGKHRSEEQKC